MMISKIQFNSIGVTCCKYSLNQLKIDQHSSMNSFKDTITMDLEQGTSRVYSRQLKENKTKEEIYNYLQ